MKECKPQTVGLRGVVLRFTTPEIVKYLSLDLALGQSGPNPARMIFSEFQAWHMDRVVLWPLSQEPPTLYGHYSRPSCCVRGPQFPTVPQRLRATASIM